MVTAGMVRRMVEDQILVGLRAEGRTTEEIMAALVAHRARTAAKAGRMDAVARRAATVILAVTMAAAIAAALADTAMRAAATGIAAMVATMMGL